MFKEAVQMLQKCNCEVEVITHIGQLESADAIIIPSSLPIPLKKYL
jgi:hypothetical protein